MAPCLLCCYVCASSIHFNIDTMMIDGAEPAFHSRGVSQSVKKAPDSIWPLLSFHNKTSNQNGKPFSEKYK